MQFLLLSFSVFLLLCSTRAIPFAEPLQERQTERPKFINEDGTLDIVNLVAASRITPNNLAPSYPSNFTIDVANSLNDAVQQAQDQQSAQVDNNSKRGFFDGCPSKLNIPSTFGNWLVPQALSTWLFSNWPTFSASANKASTTLSNGKYKQVYKNLQASYVNPSANTFLGMSTLWSYNPEACAARCNNVKGCISFEVCLSENVPLFDKEALVNISTLSHTLGLLRTRSFSRSYSVFKMLKSNLRDKYRMFISWCSNQLGFSHR